jgi:hypothetical protein
MYGVHSACETRLTISAAICAPVFVMTCLAHCERAAVSVIPSLCFSPSALDTLSSNKGIRSYKVVTAIHLQDA